MRNYFFDTSAFVKAYAIEDGSRRVRAILSGVDAVPPENQVVLSGLAHPEAASALRAIMSGPDAARRGFGAHERKTLPGVVAGQFGTLSPLEISQTDPHLADAAALAWRHQLKGADAVHLATALALRQAFVGVEFYFVSSDVALNRAAAAEGLDVLDPAV